MKYIIMAAIAIAIYGGASNAFSFSNDFKDVTVDTEKLQEAFKTGYSKAKELL
jgi:hypothetical protein